MNFVNFSAAALSVVVGTDAQHLSSLEMAKGCFYMCCLWGIWPAGRETPLHGWPLQWPCPLGNWMGVLHPLTKGTRGILLRCFQAHVSAGWSSWKAYHLLHATALPEVVFKTFLWSVVSLGCCRMGEYRQEKVMSLGLDCACIKGFF